ncbi:MAG: isocyanide synthase family protein [Actinomycetota bacterium]|nr:isocyanide synthase family protein [Actinomycetota bacterium]MDQ6946433.1 isocyanide synthase family protein [Actinomycetota bacterium]
MTTDWIEPETGVYRPPTLEEIDPSFIYLSPTVMETSEFEALDAYDDPIEPGVIKSFDYAGPRQETVARAESFLGGIGNRLSKLPTVYDRVFAIMEAKRYRAGTMTQTRFAENKDLFRPVLERHINDGSPLEFVLPSFPYKFSNPVKVARKAPDMAEILCLSQLYEICHCLSSVYEGGARMVIISDGHLYHKMFGISEYEAVEFRDQIKEMISMLGFDRSIEIVDMQDLIRSRQERYDLIWHELEPVFAKWWAQNPDNERLCSLIKSSAPNINTAGEVTHDLVQMATKDILHETDQDETLANFQKVRDRVRERSEDGAFEFALTLYTLKELNLVEQCYPQAIRATVHPKPGQWGIHLVNRQTRVFPWQGVAVHKLSNDRWTVKYEFEAIRRRAVPIHIKGELFPFYYEERD